MDLFKKYVGLELIASNLKKYPENFTTLLPGIYLVRTQAGFKQALREYANEHDDYDYWKKLSFKEVLEQLRLTGDNIKLADIKYPIVVSITPIYLGYHGNEISFLPLK